MNGQLGQGVLGAPALSRPLEQVLCILLVASAIKTPLGIPLYLNAVLLVVGLFALIVVQTLPRLYLWTLALLAVGAISAVANDSVSTSGPRLAQLFLLICASALVTRLDPGLFARYLAILPLIMVLVGIAESLLPEPLYERRMFSGLPVPRHGGLHGEPNYTAMLYGAIALILAQHRPRVWAVLPLLMAALAVSRGLIAALVTWLAARALGRRIAGMAPLLVLVLCLQPLIVLAVDWAAGDALRNELNRLSSQRYLIWVAHAKAGLSEPLGVGYFQGDAAIKEFAGLPAHHAGRQAHSIFLQVFGEFGWLGYGLFVGFLLHLTRIVARFAPAQLPLLLFVLVGYAFLNGLSDWSFWVPLGYVLAQVRLAESAAPLR